MDDDFSPSSLQNPTHDRDVDVSEEEEELEGPDWTKFPSSTTTWKPSLPKRGDKEFEPASDGPTGLQAHSLNRARDAMFDVLRVQRGISNKSVSYAVWYPSLSRAHVIQAKGVHFQGMGHSVARPSSDSISIDGEHTKVQKRTELLPEESLYLIERGSLFCWRFEPGMQLPDPRGGTESDIQDAQGEHNMRGSPMSVQQAFAEIIGKDGLTLERYHVFAYLKRLGFNVLRAKPPSPSYPTALSHPDKRLTLPSSFLTRVFHPFLSFLARLRCMLFGRIDWWKPIKLNRWPGGIHDYASIYRSLRFIPSGHSTPLHALPSKSERSHSSSITPHEPSTSYEIFYNVYKPNTPFRKSAPPPPDFSLVAVDARTTPLPTIHELTNLWSCLPETGPPPPRQRNRVKPLGGDSPIAPPTQPPPSLPSRIVSWLFGRDHKAKSPPNRKPHPFAVLKAGKKTVVIGIVDNGTVGFFRFGMGAFEEMPML